MRTRNKPPALVSMWMLDVFCCALGCAVLLWTLESLRASLMTEEAAASQVNYDKTRQELVALQADFQKQQTELNSLIADLRGRLAALTNDYDAKDKLLVTANADLSNTKSALAIATTDLTDAKKRLTAADSDLISVKDDYTKSTTRVLVLQEDLKKKLDALLALQASMKTMTQAELDLQKLLRERATENELLQARAKDATNLLNDLDAKYRAITKENTDLMTARGNVKDMQKQLDNANLNIIDLQGDKRKLADKIDKLRIESDAKFAGVAMTGKRVAFVIDISGSMKLIDEKTPDPNKWPIVVQTIGKVMRSIPDLEKYQVIVFSRKSNYLFGGADWREYKGEASVKETMDALTKTEVGGDTNMYEAFDLTFKLRDSGLDTVYLFSDGLPTSGAGLLPEQEGRITEVQRTEALARHLRTTIRLTWNRALNTKRVKVNSIGFFFESPEVGAFLWALSRENEGSFVGMSRP